jgi:hypothetical protein
MPEPNRLPHSDSFEHDDADDDLDRLFARLEHAPVPDDLTARVLANTVARDDARAALAWPWLVAGLGALALLVLAGYQLGASLAASDGLTLIEAIFTDIGLLATAPGDVLAALNEVVPWPLVWLAGLSTVLLVWAAGKVVAHPAPSLPAHSRPVG